MPARRPPPLVLPRGLFALLLLLVSGVSPAPGQSRDSGGFDYTLPAIANGEELSGQSDLWVMQVDFKPMRLVSLPVTDPQTGATTNELVWYLVWRATNRPLESPDRDTAAEPVNELDAPPGNKQFVPEFILIGEDGTAKQYQDVVLPEALPLIERRELRGRLADAKLHTTVSASGDLPERVAADPDRNGEGALYGVATWTGVDPETDRFTVLLNGFSNGYEKKTGPDGRSVIERRTGILKFWRPGDAVDENEREFRVGVDPRGDQPEAAGLPQWDYLPDEAVDADGRGDVGAEAAVNALPENAAAPDAEAAGGFGGN